ncbi:DUF4386 domain-containing protein [Deinococcus sp. Arct2-2]|uniref:DUF4386 domain-containing protein n=1 Tax=Deinococcus sp. Arct2-2 TaxID=2568653 RepID=UPI0010A418F0|nr:DUF4386 domain-containing protein [Deinococcus sp. Arct2-2]THF66726.1 DUF4386 domain-containing protein [Deinococcus sp. Arct2-2]
MTTLTPAPSATVSVRPTPRVALFAVVAAQFVLMFAAFGVLATSINWPQSLDLSAAQALPLITEQAGPVALGYTLYFLSAFLLIPLAVLTHLALQARTAGGVWLNVAATFGVLAGLLKLLGIVRWLVAMPALANAYATGNDSTRAAAAVMYDALNNYAGGVGEVLGVQLFAGLWTLMVSLVILRLPRGRMLGGAGLVSAALLLAALAQVYGADLGGLILTIQGLLWQFWLLALGVTFLRARR